jgi:very-short-patch-repair endonuclease
MSREYISCEEEERVRQGFVIETYFSVHDVPKLAHAPRLELKESGQSLIDVRYIKSARLYHFNLGWQRERERGFSISEASGSVLRGRKLEKALEADEKVAPGIALYTDEVSDAIFIQPMAALGLDPNGVTTLQYAIEHAMARVFSIEGRELASLRMGLVEGLPNIMLYESAEGSLGVLAQLFASPEKWKDVIRTARRLCAFDDEKEDKARPRASYKDLLSYANQMHHSVLDRHLIRDATQRLLDATVQLTTGESYEDHYRRMLASYDRESALEKTFIDFLFANKLALPDEAQKTFEGMYVKPDFYYAKQRVCIFIDGSAHDAPHVKEDDTAKRGMLKDAGYEVLSYHYLDNLEAFVTTNGFVFTKVEA